MKQSSSSFFKKVLAALCLLSCMTVAWAQNHSVTGTVVDQAGLPMVGVNVIEKGTMNGTVTDADGKYSIAVSSPSAVLQFSSISYVTEEVQTTGSVVNVTLRDDTTMLDDVVVIGYGTARKKDLTGSVVQVRPENLIAENPKTVQPTSDFQEDRERGLPAVIQEM